jgi:hypothetical protein
MRRTIIEVLHLKIRQIRATYFNKLVINEYDMQAAYTHLTFLHSNLEKSSTFSWPGKRKNRKSLTSKGELFN